jgi:hypothetical protein
VARLADKQTEPDNTQVAPLTLGVPSTRKLAGGRPLSQRSCPVRWPDEGWWSDRHLGASEAQR